MPLPRSAYVCIRATACGFLLSLAAACGDEGPGPIDRIEVTRDDGGPLEVMRGEVITLKARAFSGDTPRPDVVIRYRSESPEIASADSITGRIVGLGYGTAQIAVTANSEYTERVALQVIGPAIARVVVNPSSAGATIGSSVALIGVALNAAGDTVPGTEFTWRSRTPAIAQVGASTGAAIVVTGVAGGTATVEAVAWNNQTGTATITVLPVRDFTPKEGAYGTVVRILGSSFAVPAKIAFPRGAGGTLEAEIQRIAPDTIYTWVPVGAQNGPLTVTLGTVSAQTVATFTVTGGGDDVYDQGNGNDQASLGNPQIPIGFYNPALVARRGDEDWYMIPVPQPSGQLTVEISIGKGSGFTDDPDFGLQLDSLLQAVLYKLEPPTPSGSRPLTWLAGYPDSFYQVRDFFDWFWGLMSYDFTTDKPLRTLHAARAVTQPDTFFLLVHATGSQMPYGLRVLNQGVYRFPADSFEVNDWVKEARPVSFPTSIAAAAENGGSLDFYSFTLQGPDSTRVRAKLSGATGDLDLWLGLPTTTPLQTAIARGESPAANDSIVHRLGPGTYVIGVFEFAMTGTAYTLTLDIAPAAASATANAPATPVPSKWRRSPALRRPEDSTRWDPQLRIPAASPFRIPPR